VGGEPSRVRLSLRVVPNAARAEIVGWLEDGSLKVKVAAPPEGGRANREVLDLLAKTLGLGRRDLSIIAGEKGRHKIIAVRGLSEEALRATLPSSG
jgi:uncharacterized protein